MVAISLRPCTNGPRAIRSCTHDGKRHPQGQIATRLTSLELKVKPKSNNVGGLQLADLIAHPAMLAFLDDREGRPRRADYGGRLVSMLEAQKYARSMSGELNGTGRLWIP